LRNNKGINKKTETSVTVDFSDSDANDQLNGDENANAFEQMRNNYDDSFNAGDDTLAEDQQEDSDRSDGVDLGISSYTAAASRKKELSRVAPKPKKPAQSETTRAEEVTQQNETSEQGNVQKRKRPGRPPKSQRRNNDDEDNVGQRPSKKSKTANQTARGLNSSGNPEIDKVVENYVNRTGPLKGRSLYILKREVPTDGSATHTRSGRVSVRPLAYWKNERCVYGDGEAAEGQRYPLSTIKEIIRTEELEPEKRKVSRRRSSNKSKSRKSREEDSDDEDDDYVDPWEKEGGVLHGYVRKWDPDAQAASIEEEVLGKCS
jgi:centromere protein C